MDEGSWPGTASLSGADWFIHEDADGSGERDGLHVAEVPGPGWIPARTPGNIQADLEAAHVLRPLWYGGGDARLADVAKSDWWYRRDFDAPMAIVGRRLRLVFDGVDYACEVWLNGRRLGGHAGMFRRFGFEVGGIVKAGRNMLAVKVARIPSELERILEASDGKLSGGGEDYPREWGDDFFVHGINETRQLLKDLKSPTNYGWDWGVNVYTLGIWQGARLEATGSARVEWLWARASLDEDYRRARVVVKLEIDSLAAMEVRGAVCVRGSGGLVEAVAESALVRGENVLEAELVLEEPALWWPHGHGEQALYSVEAELLDAGSGAVLDRRRARIGIRDIRWEQVEGAAADFINPYRLVVNGRPVRMLGSNILPADLLFGRMDARGPRLIELAHEAGMNTLRVWGGGALLTEKMYSLADELGIMLSQEFPMSSCSPERDGVFLANLGRTVRDIVKRYRNHACIVEWSGGNEMWWSQGDEHPALELMAGIVAEDDGRMFRATCPIQGARHSPWHYDPETHYAHYDDADLSDSGMRRGENRMMRYGEFGCHSVGHVEVWQREIPPGDRWPADDMENAVLIRKNVAQAVFSEGHWLLKRILDSLFGPIDSLETLVQAGQYLGAHGLRYAVDALRRRGRTLGGLMTWALNEPWPNGAGPYLVDYDGRPLMNYDFLKQALAPISLSLRCESNLYDAVEGLEAGLWLVSDAPTAVGGLRWSWLVRDGAGEVLAANEGRASIGPMEALRLDVIGTGPREREAERILLVELRLEDCEGGLLGERVHVFAAGDSAAPLAGLLPGAGGIRRTDLEAVSVSHQVDEGSETLVIEARNRGGMTALFCVPRPMLSYRADISIGNNHVCIPPGERREIVIEGPTDAGLSLPQTGWRVSCWNADDVVIAPSEDVLFSIGRQDGMAQGYLGCEDGAEIGGMGDVRIEGARPNAGLLPYMMSGERVARFEFAVARGWGEAARLRLHTADQSNGVGARVTVAVNGRVFEANLPPGLGIQDEEPAHLACPRTVAFDLPRGALREGDNRLEVRVGNGGWFTWDAMDLVSQARS